MESLKSFYIFMLVIPWGRGVIEKTNWDLGRMKSVTRLNHAPLCAPPCHARFILLWFETSIVNFSTFLVDYCPLLVYPNVKIFLKDKTFVLCSQGGENLHNIVEPTIIKMATKKSCFWYVFILQGTLFFDSSAFANGKLLM